MVKADTDRRAHLRITGEVQGVGFRMHARRQAQVLGVGGWVRNREDGSVEALAEGDPPAVEKFIAWAHEGPAGAVVRTVEVQDEPPRGEQEFRVIG